LNFRVQELTLPESSFFKQFGEGEELTKQPILATRSAKRNLRKLSGLAKLTQPLLTLGSNTNEGI
jgi:hypothetical protein